MTSTGKNSSFDDVSTPIDQHLYKLVNQKPVSCTFGEYLENIQNPSQRIIAQTEIENVLVSTIFTGIDHSFGTGEKLLFETMVFGLPDELHPKWQYTTWEEAQAMHDTLIAQIRHTGLDALIQEIHNKADGAA